MPDNDGKRRDAAYRVRKPILSSFIPSSLNADRFQISSNIAEPSTLYRAKEEWAETHADSQSARRSQSAELFLGAHWRAPAKLFAQPSGVDNELSGHSFP